MSTVMVAFVSEWLVGTLDTFTAQFGLTELFVGAFVIAIVGNAAEHSAAVMMAMKNKIGATVEKSISQDGRTNWYEGLLLLAVYIILGVSFYLV